SISAGTTIGTNAQLQLDNAATMSIAEPLILNGPGLTNTGALLDVQGNHQWLGGIAMDSDVTLGANARTTLTISGQISDLGAAHDLTKEGDGTIVFARDNTYRGLTTINHGILRIQNPLSLGPATGTFESGTVVNSHPITGNGTLQIDGGASGFTV